LGFVTGQQQGRMPATHIQVSRQRQYYEGFERRQVLDFVNRDTTVLQKHMVNLLRSGGERLGGAPSQGEFRKVAIRQRSIACPIQAADRVNDIIDSPAEVARPLRTVSGFRQAHPLRLWEPARFFGKRGADKVSVNFVV
jgi:hypothetical protein